jgi:predicted site-specific integrase-resolvase
MKESYTTAEVAKAIGVDKSTLLRWLYAGKLAEPKQKITIGSIENRVWTVADQERARAFREEKYRKRS